MITEKRPAAKEKIEIDLRGPEGNAFALMAIANKIGKQLGMHPDERGAINAEMMSGDYDNLIKVMDQHFGDYVIMYK
jgi:hypothetical protein